VGEQTHARLQRWSKTQPDIEIIHRSIHENPAEIVRLGITHVPALVAGGKVIAQGAPEAWLTDDFLQALAALVNP
jgi:predicted DsbA family dithiol-disulfide isomerase